jgi:hypothetical protein
MQMIILLNYVTLYFPFHAKYVAVSFAYVNMREGLSVVSLYWRSNNKREIQKKLYFIIRFLLAFLVVLERMPGKRGRNG